MLLEEEANFLQDLVHLGHRRRNDSLLNKVRADAETGGLYFHAAGVAFLEGSVFVELYEIVFEG